MTQVYAGVNFETLPEWKTGSALPKEWQNLQEVLNAMSLTQTLEYVQTTDPGAVGAGARWWDTTVGLERVGIRNAANDAWVFFSNTSGTLFFPRLYFS